MAIESVPTQPRGAWCLPDEQLNRAADAIHKLRSLVECVRSASLSDDAPERGAINGALWLARDLIDELHEIAHTRQPEQAFRSATGA